MTLIKSKYDGKRFSMKRSYRYNAGVGVEKIVFLGLKGVYR